MMFRFTIRELVLVTIIVAMETPEAPPQPLDLGEIPVKPAAAGAK